jgi:hypothetical protein
MLETLLEAGNSQLVSGFVCFWSPSTEPDAGRVSSAVNVTHQGDLTSFLGIIALVDANCINPKGDQAADIWRIIVAAYLPR